MRLHFTPRTSSLKASGTGYRAPLLATAAVLALGLSGAAWAQQTLGGAQQRQGTTAQSDQTAQTLAPQLRTLEQSLRQSQEQLAGAQGQAGGQPNWDQMRSTVNNATQMLGRMPQQMQGQDAFKEAQRELNQARDAIQGQNPDRQRVASQMGEAADAVAKLHGSMDTASAQSGAAGAAGGAAAGTGARIVVQQPSPQVTVQQPAPDVTVRQAQPNVTVQQGQPQVTVQQADPKVTVQQGQPQVTVQKQGQPTVDVQRQGQAQVTTQAPTSGTATTPTSPSTARTTDRTTTGTTTGTITQGTATANMGLPLQQVSELIGTNVVGADGKDAGEIENLLVDSSGRVRAAVIEWGGFLGIGEKRAMVPIERIQMGAAGSSDRPRLEMTRAELEALPRYDEKQVGTYARDRGWGDNSRLYR